VAGPGWVALLHGWVECLASLLLLQVHSPPGVDWQLHAPASAGGLLVVTCFRWWVLRGAAAVPRR
jgi:hypothetical protein